MHALFLLALLFPQEEERDEVRSAIAKTARESYSYTVIGRYRRTGVYESPGTLTARIRRFRSARNGGVLLLKGPEGLWMKPGEEGGERVEGLDPEIAPIMVALGDAQEPHRQIIDLLPLLAKGRLESTRKVEGVPCRILVFSFDKSTLREGLDAQMQKGIARGVIEKPTRVRWSTLRGTVRVYLHAKTGHLLRVIDRRSVKIFHRTGKAEEVKKYTNEMDYRFAGQGSARVGLPVEVKKRLGIE